MTGWRGARSSALLVGSYESEGMPTEFEQVVVALQQILAHGRLEARLLNVGGSQKPPLTIAEANELDAIEVALKNLKGDRPNLPSGTMRPALNGITR